MTSDWITSFSICATLIAVSTATAGPWPLPLPGAAGLATGFLALRVDIGGGL